jgi:DNA-directed RNA polymerase subunit beta'
MQQFRPSGFKAMMGAEAIKELLKRVRSTSWASSCASA